MAYHKDKDGTSLLTWLSTFAVGQGAALVAVLQSQRGREQFALVMSLYVAFAILTIASIVIVLRWTVRIPMDEARQKEIPEPLLSDAGDREGTDVLGRPVRLEGKLERVLAYEQRTVWFGRMVLGFMLLMTGLFFVLGLLGMLQGQTDRLAFSGTKRLNITSPTRLEDVEKCLKVSYSAVGEELSHRLVYEATGLVPETDQNSRLALPAIAVMGEQFDQNYDTFVGTIYIEGQTIKRGLAYLWRRSTSGAGLENSGVLETLAVSQTEDGRVLVEVVKPNKGDKLLMVAKIPLVNKQPVAVDNLYISLTKG
jgi:hypothetical protein